MAVPVEIESKASLVINASPACTATSDPRLAIKDELSPTIRLPPDTCVSEFVRETVALESDCMLPELIVIVLLVNDELLDPPTTTLPPDTVSDDDD